MICRKSSMSPWEKSRYSCQLPGDSTWCIDSCSCWSLDLFQMVFLPSWNGHSELFVATWGFYRASFKTNSIPYYLSLKAKRRRENKMVQCCMLIFPIKNVPTLCCEWSSKGEQGRSSNLSTSSGWTGKGVKGRKEPCCNYHPPKFQDTKIQVSTWWICIAYPNAKGNEHVY